MKNLTYLKQFCITLVVALCLPYQVVTAGGCFSKCVSGEQIAPDSLVQYEAYEAIEQAQADARADAREKFRQEKMNALLKKQPKRLRQAQRQGQRDARIREQVIQNELIRAAEEQQKNEDANAETIALLSRSEDLAIQLECLAIAKANKEAKNAYHKAKKNNPPKPKMPADTHDEEKDDMEILNLLQDAQPLDVTAKKTVFINVSIINYMRLLTPTPSPSPEASPSPASPTTTLIGNAGLPPKYDDADQDLLPAPPLFSSNPELTATRINSK